MAVANASVSSPPVPEECAHPAPVVGVMAHEFGHYSGAQGPEGTRRTVTYYGPVIGGLPIQAWHCPACGVLKLTHPDGRRDQRLLHPGRQAGLIVEAVADSRSAAHFGMQPHVSGLSMSPQLLDQLAEVRPTRVARRSLAAVLGVPALDAVTWVIVLALSFVAAGLLAAGYLATFDWTTPAAMGALGVAVVLGFGAAMLLLVGGAVWRHYGPDVPLSPSVAHSGRGAVGMDVVTRSVVALLTLSLIGFFVAASLAVYAWTTPDAELPVIVAAVGCGALAVLLFVGHAVVRHLHRG